MAEIRVFHNDRFLCRAVSAELAGATVPLREIIRARNLRCHELRGVLRDRQAAVDTLLEMTKRRPRNLTATSGPSMPMFTRFRNRAGHQYLPRTTRQPASQDLARILLSKKVVPSRSRVLMNSVGNSTDDTG
jgi:hypothetical protein